MDHRKLTNPIDTMTPEEKNHVCCLILALPFDRTHKETLIGGMINRLNKWGFNIQINERNIVTLTIINVPKEFEIKAYSLMDAFLQAALIKGEWKGFEKPLAVELAEPPENK